MEEYTEMFEHIDEYRSDMKKHSKKSPPVQTDGSSSDTTASENESDPSSEEEDEIDTKTKKLKSSKQN